MEIEDYISKENNHKDDYQEQIFSYQTNNGRLMKTLGNSVYDSSGENSNKIPFLRELVSNASDAIDKYIIKKSKNDNKFNINQVSQDILLEYYINIIPDKDNETIVITDNGIGMTKNELINNIGTIASSGTNKFSNENNVNDLIGQFGLGFYSVFIVSSQVEIITTSDQNGTLETYLWKSKNDNNYSITKIATKQNCGTSIIIKIKKNFKDIINSDLIKNNIRQYCYYVKYSINVQKIDNKDGSFYFEHLNCQEKPIWRRIKSEIKPEEYDKFYKNYLACVDDAKKPPLINIHKKYIINKANISFLLFIPAKAPFNLGEENPNEGYKIKLYSKGILISDSKSDYYPSWMKFAIGIVEIDGLDLNINRQSYNDENKIVKTVKNQITNEFISIMEDLKQNKYQYFHTLNTEFGDCIKYGIIEELGNRNSVEDDMIGISHAKRLFNLILFYTSKNRQITLDKYVENMKDEQVGIYYIAGGQQNVLINSPFIERLIQQENHYEVLFFTDNIDEHLKNYLVGYIKNTNTMIVGIEDKTAKDEDNETTLKVYDDIDENDVNTKRFIDVARNDLLIKFDDQDSLDTLKINSLISSLTKIYQKIKGIDLHSIKTCNKFKNIPAIVTSQVSITAQYENYLANQDITRRDQQYSNILKRKNLLISPSNKTIKWLYNIIIVEGDNKTIHNIINKTDKIGLTLYKFLINMYQSAMLVGGYQLNDYVGYSLLNYEYSHKFITEEIKSLKNLN